MSTSTPTNTAPQDDKPAQKHLRRGSARRYTTLALAILVLGFIGHWLYHQFTTISISDARISADMVAISSRVPGWATEVTTRENQPAAKGAVLAQVDSRQSHLQLKALNAQLDGIAQQRKEIAARIHLTDQQTASAINASRSALKAAEAKLASAQAQYKLAQTNNRRTEKSLASGATTQSHLDQTRAALEVAHQHVRQARAERQSRKTALQQAQAERGQLDILKQQLAELGPQAKALRAQRQQALEDIQDRTIVMPFNGTVDKVFADSGEYVGAGQQLMIVHNPQRIRVEAKVKETNIRYVYPGKKVYIQVDALPGKRFTGTVKSVGQAATSEFALLPNPNPSGNFTKIAQRIPIRIAISQDHGQLKPGMMVEVQMSKTTRDSHHHE